MELKDYFTFGENMVQIEVVPLNTDGNRFEGNKNFPLINGVFQTTPDPGLETKKKISFNRKHLSAIMYWNKRPKNLKYVTANWRLIVHGEEVFFKKFQHPVDDPFLEFTSLYHDEDDGSTSIFRITSSEIIKKADELVYLSKGHILFYDSRGNQVSKSSFSMIKSKNNYLRRVEYYRKQQSDGSIQEYLFVQPKSDKESVDTFVLDTADATFKLEAQSYVQTKTYKILRNTEGVYLLAIKNSNVLVYEFDSETAEFREEDISSDE